MSVAIVRRYLQIAAWVGCLGLIVCGCATLQAPRLKPVYPEQELLSESAHGITIKVKPIVETDDYLQLFDDNLPRIGIVALWVEVRNASTSAIEVRSANWRIRTGGREVPVLSIPELFKRYYRGSNVRLYALGNDRSARADIGNIALPDGWIEPTLKRNGFLFFAVDRGTEAGWNREGTLLARGIQLNRRAKLTLEVALSHGH